MPSALKSVGTRLGHPRVYQTWSPSGFEHDPTEAIKSALKRLDGPVMNCFSDRSEFLEPPHLRDGVAYTSLVPPQVRWCQFCAITFLLSRWKFYPLPSVSLWAPHTYWGAESPCGRCCTVAVILCPRIC